MGSIIFITRARVTDIGPGGRHRSYQITHDLVSHFGAERVHVLSLQDWREQTHTDAREPRVSVGELCLNPLRALIDTGYAQTNYTPHGFAAHYAAYIAILPQPLIAVVDDVRLARILDINLQRQIPTILCPHNLETLDMLPAGSGRVRTRAHMLDFATEIERMRAYDARLFVSKVEAGLISGLSMSAGYYPYLPAGQIGERWRSIRVQRSRTRCERGLFLMLGSAMHASTRYAFEHFIAQIRTTILPTGIRIVLVGSGTEHIDITGLNGIETRGWTEQNELDHLLVAAQGILAPQLHGFGAVSRIADLACAGIPTLTGRHAAWAINIPPGVQLVDDSWPTWLRAMEQISTQSPEVTGYDEWERTQPQPLCAEIERILRERATP